MACCRNSVDDWYKKVPGVERIPYIDGIRGYLIYSMTLSHLAVLGANGLWWASHKSASVFFTGEGFMAISGLMMGYITFGAVTRKGVVKSLFSSVRRSWKILRYYLVVYVLCLLPLLLFDLAGDETLAMFFRERDPATPGSLGLFLTGIYRPLMFDILYLYIILIGLSPLIIFAALRLGAPWVLSASFALWLSAQYGLVDKVNAKLAGLLGGDPGLLFGSFSHSGLAIAFRGGRAFGHGGGTALCRMARASDLDTRNTDALGPGHLPCLRTVSLDHASGACGPERHLL